MLAMNKKRIQTIIGLIFLIVLTWFFNKSGSQEHHVSPSQQRRWQHLLLDRVPRQSKPPILQRTNLRFSTYSFKEKVPARSSTMLTVMIMMRW
jgi:hypothetical protein